MLFLSIILILLLAFIAFRSKTLNVLCTSIFCASFIILLVVYSKDAISSCIFGINLWFDIVFPSIFPFLVICNIISNTNISLVIGKFFEPIMRPLFNVPGCAAPAFILGILSGYPIGATVTLSLYQQNLITKLEAERLITFTNNSGPLFIISSIGYGLFGNKKIGILLYLCHILSAISVGIIFSFYKKNDSCPIKKSYLSSLSYTTPKSHPRFSHIFTNAIISSIAIMTNIAGFIIFFSVVINLLIKIGFFQFATIICTPIIALFSLEPNVIPAYLSGLFEMTYGISSIAHLTSTHLDTKLLLTSFLLGFAGMSILFQIQSVLSKSDIRITPFVIAKLLQGTLATIFLALMKFYFVY